MFDTPSHPGYPGRGLEWLAGIAALGQPVIALGGITPAGAVAARAAGAWGVAVITAVWGVDDPAAAAAALLAPWAEAA